MDKNIKEDAKIMIKDCLARQCKLNDWEHSFIESINDQLNKSDYLSEKQLENLDKIWEKIT